MMRRETRASLEPARMRGGRVDLHWPVLKRQIAECIMLPALAATLPWPLAWRAIRALAARGRLFEGEAERAQAAWSAHDSLIQERKSWLECHRLMRIVDHVDPALSLARSDGFLDRHVIVDGDAIPAAPCLFVGFHYGTGFWSLRHLRRLGHHVSFLAAPVTRAHWPGQPLAFAFARLRKTGVERAGNAPVILVGGSADTIRAALRSGTSVLALIDVPEPTTTTVTVRLLGHDVQFPDGILRIGAAERVPLIGYVASLDARGGTRHLRFTRLPDDPAAALHALAAMLDAAIRRDPAAWHFWAEWPRFAKRAPCAAAGEGGIAGLR
jgi:phosphatidylinositol dimannoside acyltransferase